MVFRDRVRPHWSADGNRFWYRNDLADGKQEYIVVNAIDATRRPAFSHQAVAEAFGKGASADKLPIMSLEFAEQPEAWILVCEKESFLWNSTTNSLTPHTLNPQRIGDSPSSNNVDRGARTGAESELTFDNRLTAPVEIFWVDGDGQRHSYGKIAAGTRKDQHTFGGHRWLILDAQAKSLGEVVANDTPSVITIDGRPLESPRTSARRGRARRDTNGSGRSPDGQWIAEVVDSNLLVRSAESQAVVLQSHDGSSSNAYGNISWAPDSKSLVAWRTEAGDIGQVHLVRSSPTGGGRAQLESRAYALPGDKFPMHEVNLFRVDTLKQIKPEVDRFEHESRSPRVRWSSDSTRCSYEQVDRGHQRFRLIELKSQDGSASHLIDERSQTFIWSAHTAGSDLEPIHYLSKSEELIYLTEQSGWRHMQLIDGKSGKLLNDITSGQWVVRGIESIDEVKRRIWFRASGVFDQDPYLIHFGAINFDGSNLTWLTSSNGNHTLDYSPDRRFVIDTHSRVDSAPTTELRRVSDGGLVCELERADISKLVASGWKAPEVFTAKGRDGLTDIWGIICRPRDYDPNKSYPVIEDIYAGPHGAFVPKSFSATQRYADLTELGFIVVKIDGMGTAHRSKKFQDVCWQNLKDAGFEDRILWMKAAAARYPEMDITRVGIYGTSAGGQNAAAAVLFHPEFYKAAVAACGCHDNRMDKASWNEQWMGYPVGPHYGQSSNIDNAARLQGKLMLIVGEVDTNVPPESTLRFADALIRADKDFDLLVIPNMGHSNGGPYGQRRTREFFVKHLQP